jgi:hypothetical protein
MDLTEDGDSPPVAALATITTFGTEERKTRSTPPTERWSRKETEYV